MHPIVYDACRFAGLAMAAAGAWMSYGAPAGLMTAGGLLIALTELGARR